MQSYLTEKNDELTYPSLNLMNKQRLNTSFEAEIQTDLPLVPSKDDLQWPNSETCSLQSFESAQP